MSHAHRWQFGCSSQHQCIQWWLEAELPTRPPLSWPTAGLHLLSSPSAGSLHPVLWPSSDALQTDLNTAGHTVWCLHQNLLHVWCQFKVVVVLPVMTTCEAPIALATSKLTNPIGPKESEKKKHIDVTYNERFHYCYKHVYSGAWKFVKLL